MWADDAEMLLADLCFKEEEDKDESWKKLKLKVLELYNLKLDEREFRKRFILERELLDAKKMEDELSPVPHDASLSRVFAVAKYLSKSEFEELYNGFQQERQIREEIKKLREYRSLGIRTMADADRWEKKIPSHVLV